MEIPPFIEVASTQRIRGRQFAHLAGMVLLQKFNNEMKNVKGKIILIDDEPYEKDFLERALKEKNWDIKIEYFNNVDDAIEHLKMNADEIFIIISDMDMPKKTGMDLKKIIDNDPYLKQKSIPFIFASNSLSIERVLEAYSLNVQGYFKKPMNPEEQAKLLEIIIQYWIACIHPMKEDLPENPNLIQEIVKNQQKDD